MKFTPLIPLLHFSKQKNNQQKRPCSAKIRNDKGPTTKECG